MIKLLQFLIGWIFILAISILAFIQGLLCGNLRNDSMFDNTEPKDIVGQQTWDAMMFKW